jgi:adenylyl-sulfate kinase
MLNPAVRRPHVFWLFGLSGAGKSTLARSLADNLRASGIPVLSLDGDELRQGVCRELGFSNPDRNENLRRAAEVAKLGLQSELMVVASFITPLAAHRLLVSEIVHRDKISLIFLNASVDICRDRDFKGLYRATAAGTISHMSGISSLFEAPSEADLILHTGSETADLSAGRLQDFARKTIKGSN